MTRLYTLFPLVAFALCCSSGAWSESPDEILLWPDGPAEKLGDGQGHEPALYHYPATRPDDAGTAVVVCPGGGYGGLAKDHEGIDVARWLNDIGVTAFVLHYRHAPYRHPVPVNDLKRAMMLIRSKSKSFGIDKNRLGVIGFSAGGHLVSTLATHFDRGDPDADNPVERESNRPDFVILGYPVITFTVEPFVHKGSRKNLLGESVDPQLAEALSNEKQVTAETPPAFLFHATNDGPVPPENSILFYEALKPYGVPCELHLFHSGGHGFGLRESTAAGRSWPALCREWMIEIGMLENP